MKSWRPLILFAVVMSCCITFTESSVAPNGWTIPSEMLQIEKGSDLNISCGVTGGGYMDQHLTFFNYSDNREIDSKYIKKVSNSEIFMRIPNVEEQDTNIVCKSGGTHGIGYVNVRVGHKPDEIKSIDCISNNWYDMNCTFEKPPNPVLVTYEMKYRVLSSQQRYSCNVTETDSKIFKCYINNAGYRNANRVLEFLLTATNTLGRRTQNFIVRNFASVVPAKPENFQVLNVTSDSVALAWKVHSNLLAFPDDFDFEFSIESGCNGLQKYVLWNISSMENERPRDYTHIIPLTFANIWYKVSLRMRISTAPMEERMWSEWSKIDVMTTSRRPDNPPQVDIGGFNIGGGGNVYIYWKHPSKCYQSGANYSYSVTFSDSKNKYSDAMVNPFATYSKDRINLKTNTTFVIRSQNSAGFSRQASEIVIPANRLAEPTKINKIISNGNYHLSWSPPINPQEPVTSYTVFWCVSKSEKPNNCEGSINFERLLPNKTHFTYDSRETINFAVSANSASSTSGMAWALCTTANSNEIGKIRTIWIPRLAATEIEVEWKLECTDSGIVAGYQLEYCPSSEPKTLECMEPEKKINITTKLDNPKHIITGLMPYTTYKISIRMFSNSTMGQASDPLANTTLEAAPSEIRNLIARNIGNTSVELYWDPPEFSNGVLLFYKVWANGKNYNINDMDLKIEIDNSHITRMNYTLKGLMAYTDYDIAVEACTKECSKAIQTKFKTTIGRPGNFSSQPDTKTAETFWLNNSTMKVVRWDPPTFSGGELDYYEFRTVIEKRDGSVVGDVVKLRQRLCDIEELCAARPEIVSYQFSVRAVNLVLTPHMKESPPQIEGSSEPQFCNKDDAVLLASLGHLKKLDPHSWKLPGPWSPVATNFCQSNGSNKLQAVMLVSMMLASLLIIGMIYFSYKKIKDMKDILVQMPPGLEDLTGDKIKKGKDLHSHLDMLGKPDILHNVDSASMNCEDESGRLLKKSMNGSVNGADCSSSIHSDSTRSDIEPEDTVEYGAFGNDDLKRDSVGLQSFLINPVTGEDISPILITPEAISMPTSTPVAEKIPKPNIILNPKMPIPSSGYVTQPPRKVISPTSPMTSNGYVTHSMFNPMQSGGGYTPFSAFGKPQSSPSNAIEEKNSIKTPIVATTDQEGISGYVTHRQLSDFGHRMQ